MLLIEPFLTNYFFKEKPKINGVCGIVAKAVDMTLSEACW